MRIQKGLTTAVLIKSLTITLCVLGCGEAQEPTDETVFVIQTLASVKDTLYLAAHADGVFRLNNRSHSWENIFTDGVARSLATNETTLYVSSTSGVFRFEHEESFTKITPQGELLGASLVADGERLYASWVGKLFRRKTDGGEEWLRINTSWDDDARIHSLAVKGNTIYVLTQQYGVFSSIDGGKEWTAINTGLPNQPVTSIGFLLSPLLLFKNTIYLGTRTGVYRLPIGTISWIPSGLHDRDITSLVASETTLYAAEWNGGIFCSNDDGHSWRPIQLDGVKVRTLAVFGNRLYVGTESREGLFFSEDEGATWHPLNKGLIQLLR